jgi:dTDP-4-amino-4,6-dideoxygalactose transaminase
VEDVRVIRFQRPEIPPVGAIATYFARSEQVRWYSNGGPCHELLVERFERRLGAPVGVVPVANCTLGIMLALRALARPGGATEVLLPSFTFAATAAAVTWCGLQPVFIDVDASHWMLDPDCLADAVEARGERVAAILACATFGGPVPLEVGRQWEAIAASAGVPLIVDSAAGLGAVDAAGVPTGRLGDAEVFSMHATKPFAIGEGGLVCSRHPDIVEAVRRLANFGFDRGTVTSDAGMNAKLAEWPCATALAVLDQIDEVLRRRRASAAGILGGVGASCTPQALDAAPTWQFVPLMAQDSSERTRVLAALSNADIEARTYFDPPLHEMPAFKGALCIGDLSRTSDLAARALSLPMANDLSAVEIAEISTVVHRTSGRP